MLADAVASAVLRRYASLPKHGKPQPGEYTLLAGFAVTDDAVPDAPPRVVALGTGTKCLPASSRCPRGEALSDSHAEVIARRAFVRFLYDELERAASDDGDGETKRDATDANASTRSVPIVEWIATTTTTTTPFRLRGGVRVHLYATQSPCGDASIFDLTDARETASVAPADGETADGETPKERFPDALFRAENASRRAANKRAKTSSGGSGSGSGSGAGSFFLGATGAKVFESCEVSVQGSREALRVDAERGVAGQRLGACRLKPGRGAQTDCMSCSDKIARWVALGVQGALPSSLISRTATLSDRSDHLESSQVSQLTGSDVETYGAVRLASVVVASPPSSEYREECENNDFGRSTRRAVLDALRRALVDRVGFCVPTRDVPGVFVAPPAPPELSSSAGQARGWVASGTSLNWYWRENRESAPDRKKRRPGSRGERRRGYPRRDRAQSGLSQKGAGLAKGTVAAVPRVARRAVRGGDGVYSSQAS